MSRYRDPVPWSVYAAGVYAILLLLCLFLDAAAWSHWVSGHLYVDDDSVGIIDFIPPFEGIFNVPQRKLYLLWAALVGAAVLAPILVVGTLGFFWRKDEERTSRPSQIARISERL